MDEVDLYIVEELRKAGCVVEACGSRVTNPNSIKEGSDYDFLVCVIAEDGQSLMVMLEAEGFIWEGGQHYAIALSSFMSWRKGKVNLICTSSTAFFNKHKFATKICKLLALPKKSDRIKVFQAILYDDWEFQPKVID